MKILYCCQHPASLLKAICHKLEYFKDEEALILIEGQRCADIHKIKSINYIEYGVIFNSTSEEHLTLKLNEYINGFLKTNCINLKEYDHIYCIWDVNHIWSLYFTLHSIKYNLIEFADNQINYYNSENFKKDRLNRSLGRYFFDSLALKFSIYSEKNQNIKTIQYNSNNSRVPAEFDNRKKTKLCTDDYQNQIIEAENEILKELYGIANFHAPSDTVLLTNSIGYTIHYLKNSDHKQFFNWKGQNTVEDDDIKAQNAAFFYLLTIDYLFKECKFCIKFHPASGNLEKLINNITLVEKNIPYEIIKNDFSKSVCFLYTNALNYVDNQRKLILGVGYSKVFYSIPFLSWSINLFKELDSNSNTILLNGFDTNVINYFFNFSGINTSKFINFSERINFDDKYVFLKNYFIFDNNCELMNYLFDLMNNESILIVHDKLDKRINPLDKIFYINFKCQYTSNKFKLNNHLEYFAIVFKNIYNHKKIIDIYLKYKSIYLQRADLNIDIEMQYNSDTYNNILESALLYQSITNNEKEYSLNSITSKLQDKFECLKLFSTQLQKLRNNSNDNLICLIDDNNNLIKVDSVNSCTFLFRGKNNVIILHKDNQFVNCRFEALDNCLYFIKKSRSKISLNICNWTCPNVKFLIDENFCCSSTCKITLPNSDSYIGKECMFSYGIEIRGTDGHTIFDNKGNIIRNKEYLYIGNHVWIGCHARVLKNSFIQNNSIIGMNAVVKGIYVNHGSVLAGNPAKVVRYQALWSRHQNSYFDEIS